MKNSINALVCALALVATAFTANADDKETKKSTGFGTGIYTTKNGKISLMVEKPNASASTTIVLRNTKNEIFYRETVSKDSQKFGRILNVDALAEGKYQIQVTSKGETQTKSFEVTQQTATKLISIK